MLKLLLVLILSPVIILAATMAVCAIISAGFEVLVKLLILVAAFCAVRWIFTICERAS